LRALASERGIYVLCGCAFERNGACTSEKMQKLRVSSLR